jgi:hypothetical protein
MTPITGWRLFLTARVAEGAGVDARAFQTQRRGDGVTFILVTEQPRFATPSCLESIRYKL